jgi:hypothetical protein
MYFTSGVLMLGSSALNLLGGFTGNKNLKETVELGTWLANIAGRRLLVESMRQSELAQDRNAKSVTMMEALKFSAKNLFTWGGVEENNAVQKVTTDLAVQKGNVLNIGELKQNISRPSTHSNHSNFGRSFARSSDQVRASSVNVANQKKRQQESLKEAHKPDQRTESPSIIDSNVKGDVKASDNTSSSINTATPKLDMPARQGSVPLFISRSNDTLMRPGSQNVTTRASSETARPSNSALSTVQLSPGIVRKSA